MFNFLNSRRNEVSLMVDIGNGSIGGAFVLFSKKEVPRLLYSLRLPFKVSDRPDSDRLFKGMGTLLDELLSTMIKKGFNSDYLQGNKRKIESALVTFSSPWFMSKTKHINLAKDKPFIVSRAFMDDITEKEEQIFEKELLKDNNDLKDNSFEVIEKSVIHTKINGYTLLDIIGKKTKLLDAFLCMSIVEKSIKNKVDDLILKYTHIPKEKIFMHSFPLVSFVTIRDIFHDTSNFIIMDITGEVTDLTLVLDDIITKTVSFPSGKNFVIRQISKAFKVPSEIAISTLHAYTAEKTNDFIHKQMQAVFTDIEKEWSIYLEESLAELSPNMVFPSNLYITSDSDIVPLYLDFLKLSKTDSTSTWRNNLNIIHLNQEIISSLYKNNSTMPSDEFIGTLSIFYNKLFQNQ